VLTNEPSRSDLRPPVWWWGLELGVAEVKMSGQEGVELRHAGNDLVAVVGHDDGRFGGLLKEVELVAEVEDSGCDSV
jgi:hypothetical protein